MRTVPTLVAPVVGVDRNSTVPLYRQLYDGYRNAVVERRLRGGQRVPSTRSLAAELRVSRIAVLGAFEQLLAEGYFETRPGSGTFVARALPDEISKPSRPGAAVPAGGAPGHRPLARRAESIRGKELRPWWKGRGAFNVGEPPLDRFPFTLWSSLVARSARKADAPELTRGTALGLPALREAVAEYLRAARAVRCEADQVMITAGSQQGLDLAARVLLDAGDGAWIEEPGYFGIRKVLSLAGVRAIPVPVDEEGIDVAEGRARGPRARVAFVTPSHQFPLGVTMSAARRLQLLDWARRTGAWIVEDDYDSEYRYGNLPIASLQGLDRDARVIYVGTFTKILVPGLRLGYLVLPADLVPAFVDARAATDFYSPTFHQAVLADFIREGHFARHIRRIRVVCGQRRAAIVDAIGKTMGGAMSVVGDEAGMYLTATLPPGTDDRAIAASAADAGIWTPPLSDAYMAPPRQPGLILGYGGTDLPAIEAGIARLREVIERAPSARSPAPRRRAPGPRRRSREPK